MGGRLALQLLGALAVIAAALLDPFQAAIGVTGLVGVVLIDAGVHPALASGFLGIFWINGSGEYSRPGRGGAAGVASFLGLASAAFGAAGAAAGAAAAAAGAAAASAAHWALRKSFHFWAPSVPAALAALYFALHSCVVRACAGDVMASAAKPDTATAHNNFA